MTRTVVEIRAIVDEEVKAVEQHIAFDWAASSKHRQRLLRQQKGEVVYLIAWLDGLPVGHVLLKWNGMTDEPVAFQIRNCPDIEDLFVAPHYRSRGVGSQLLNACENLVRERAYTSVGLGVSIDNPRARALYERRGYQDTGLGEYTNQWKYIDRDGQQRLWTETCNYLVKQLG